MSFDRMPDDRSTVWRVPAASALVPLWGMLTTRIIGRRAISKPTNVDFVSTVALGSIVGNVTATTTSFWKGALAVFSLLLVQWLMAKALLDDRIATVVDNQPLLLKDGPHVLETNMRAASMTESDVRAQLREVNVTDTSRVLAVVLETTGDISVLHGGSIDESLLADVGHTPQSGVRQ